MNRLYSIGEASKVLGVSITSLRRWEVVEVVILNQGYDTTFEEDLAKDVLEIITVFSARLYGS